MTFSETSFLYYYYFHFFPDSFHLFPLFHHPAVVYIYISHRFYFLFIFVTWTSFSDFLKISSVLFYIVDYVWRSLWSGISLSSFLIHKLLKLVYLDSRIKNKYTFVLSVYLKGMFNEQIVNEEMEKERQISLVIKLVLL